MRLHLPWPLPHLHMTVFLCAAAARLEGQSWSRLFARL